MTLKGKVSSVEVEGVRVIFTDKDDIVSTPLKAAAHVGVLQPGDDVAVILFAGRMTDGLIIAKF